MLSKKNKNSYGYLFYNKANCYYLYETKQYNKAKQLILKLLIEQKESKRADFNMEMNNLLSKIYNQLGDNTKALKYYKNYSTIKDSLRNITKLNALSYYQTLYETELQEKEISNQKNSIVTLAKENEAKNRLILFGSVAAILTFLIFWLYRNKLQLKRKKRLQEEYAQKLLLSQEEERKRISKDLHDGLGQSLLLIKNKIALTNNNDTELLVNNAIEEMRGISRVLHPFQLADIGITKALENLILRIDSSFNETYIFGDIENIDTILTQNQEVHIFRIIQECLSNIMKHAKAASAKVDLKLEEKYISINIKDNGIGFDFSERYNDFNSLGLKTIKDRVKLLKGTLKIDSTKNEGSTFKIIFPIK